MEVSNTFLCCMTRLWVYMHKQVTEEEEEEEEINGMLSATKKIIYAALQVTE